VRVSKGKAYSGKNGSGKHKRQVFHDGIFFEKNEWLNEASVKMPAKLRGINRNRKGPAIKEMLMSDTGLPTAN
jgi:hypothetical protein